MNIPVKERPYILFLNDESDTCIDARTNGNNAMYIRRSCNPNAEIKQVLVCHYDIYDYYY
jgi:SET domain-containing protein